MYDFIQIKIIPTRDKIGGGVTSAKKLLKNFIKMFAGNVIGQLFFFLGLTYLARVLKPSGFGVWNFAQIWMLYLMRGSEFGLEVVGIQETSRNPARINTWVPTIISVRFVLAILLFGGVVIVSTADLLPVGTESLVLIFAFTTMPMAFILEWVFEGRQEVGLISIARILKGVLFCVGVFLMVSNIKDIERAAYIYIGSLILPILIIFVLVIKRFGIDWSSISFRNGLNALIKSTPIGIATLLSGYSLFVTPMMVGYFLSREELGFFTAAHRIVLFLWAYVTSSMQRILLPSLSRSYYEALPNFQRFVERFFRLSVLAAVPMGIIGLICATQLMKFLYSAQYEASGVVFGILLWGFVIANIRSILEIALIAADRQQRFMKGMVILSISYSLLTPVLILLFGIVGAAVAVVSSEFCYFGYLIFTCPYSKPISFLKNLWKPLVAALMAIVLLLLNPTSSLIIRMVLSTTVFGIVIIALKGVLVEDFEVIISLFKRTNLESST